ncbi:unnamed protein product, partial [Rotaria sp. Silwood1]
QLFQYNIQNDSKHLIISYLGLNI